MFKRNVTLLAVFLIGVFTVTAVYAQQRPPYIAAYWKDGVWQTLSLPNGTRSSSTNAVTVSGNMIYIAGRYGNDAGNTIACYWRNGILQPLSIPNGAWSSDAYDIAVSGDVVYVVGGYINAAGNGIACYWRNGEMHNLSLPNGASSSGATDIAISGDTVYILGHYYGMGFSKNSCYWKNGEVYTLSIPSGRLDTTSGIAVSGDVVYVAGIYQNAGLNRVCYWRNGVFHNLNQTLSLPSGANEPMVSAIAVSDDVLYFAGTYYNNESKSIACYWKNGVPHNLSLPSGSGGFSWSSYAGFIRIPTSIAVSGDVVYVAGSYSGTTTYKASACYWRNGVVHNLSFPSSFPSNIYGAYLSGIAVSGNTVHIVGTLVDETMQ